MSMSQRPAAKREPLDGLQPSRYRKIKDINSGSYGPVQLCHDNRTNEQVAVKFIERGEKITKYVGRELLNHNRLLHPHIIQFKEVFVTNEFLGIAMEFAPGGDMLQYVKQRNGLQEHEARWFFQQLIKALDHCHKIGVVNLNIKLETTLLDNSERPLVKICDFGYPKHAKDSLSRCRVYSAHSDTSGYSAPEVISNKRHYDGVMADVWSSGVMLYVMLFGQYPFERPGDEKDAQRNHDSRTEAALFCINSVPQDIIHVLYALQKRLYRIVSADYHFPTRSPPGSGVVSEACKDLMRRMFVADPTQRITIPEIQVHTWYQQDLPPGLTGLNDVCLAQQGQSGAPLSAQTEEQIKATVQEAKVVSFSNSDQPVFHDDQDTDYIDDVMDQEYSYTACEF